MTLVEQSNLRHLEKKSGEGGGTEKLNYQPKATRERLLHLAKVDALIKMFPIWCTESS